MISKAFFLALLKVAVALAGLIVVAVAIPFRRYSTVRIQFSQYPQLGEWSLVRLPEWALWWDNPYDGLLGDKRGWWANERGGNHESFLSTWLWAAVRNPANYFSRNVVGVDVANMVIRLVAGDQEVSEEPGRREWQLLSGVKDGKEVRRFWLCFAYPFAPDHALMIDLGWKIKLSHNGTTEDAPPQDRFKGLVFVISPWKSLS